MNELKKRNVRKGLVVWFWISWLKAQLAFDDFDRTRKVLFKVCAIRDATQLRLVALLHCVIILRLYERR